MLRADPGAARPTPSAADLLIAEAELTRGSARDSLSEERQAELGQFFTPVWVAELMASMVPLRHGHVRVLDPGAGAGVLCSTYGAHLLRDATRASRLSVTAFEIDQSLRPFLDRSTQAIVNAWEAHGLPVDIDIRMEDFADSASRHGLGDLFSNEAVHDVAILNPPYRKLGSGSDLRARLDALGIHAPNLYAAFLGLAATQVAEGGAIVAIVPRSFCNGTYFRRFRRFLLEACTLREVHLFRHRNRAFRQDSVLQENVILSLIRGSDDSPTVRLSFSDGTAQGSTWHRDVRRDQILHPADADQYIHLPEDEWNERVAGACRGLPTDLQGLGVRVSTGPVVDFRHKDSLGHDAPIREESVPMLYPLNFRTLVAEWPVEGKKPQFLAANARTVKSLVETGWYVVTKRFSSKEEKRRVVASVIDPERFESGRLAIENHLNFFHAEGGPLDRALALGLATFLNSTLVDRYFRQFSGHTQVNAGDLRKIRYPSRESLSNVGCRLDTPLIGQEADDLLRIRCPELETMPGSNKAQDRIDQAVEILRSLGLPKEQVNERSGLTLLALLGLGPGAPWSDASDPLIGVTPIMEWADRYYDRKYAPNSRETFRRFTLHQFVDAALVVANPDKPDRAVNSPKYCYQVEATALELLRQYSSTSWSDALEAYGSKQVGLREQYAQRRQMEKIPLVLGEGLSISLTPGGQNELVKEIVTEFCPRFVPGGEPVYVGDTGEKWAYFDEALAGDLGIAVDEHGKMPDLVVYDREKHWLLLIEAVTSHGPVNPKRMKELKGLLSAATAGFVFVTAFLDRATFVKYLSDIAWETEVWVAESPGHLIHFDGLRFLGPYDGISE
jgi:adenine-specific DNA-methyltransferase